MLIQTGIPDKEAIEAVTPDETRFLKGAVAIAECFQKIPCNPCTKACVKKAIRIEPDINETPKIDFDVCNGCGACMLKCPGLAIFVVDKTYSPTEALVKLPFEFLPLPEKGELACSLNRSGEPLGWFPVAQVSQGGAKNKTNIVCLVVPKELAMDVRAIKVRGYQNG